MARAFTDPGQQPTIEALESTLAGLGPRFRGLLLRTSGLSFAWTFHKGSGWLLKVHARRKALCWVIPHEGGFVVRGTLREPERDALSQADGLERMRTDLERAQKYPEGYLVQIEVFDDDRADLLDRFIEQLMMLRGLSPARTPST